MKIGDIVYLTEPVRWRKTPDGDWNEYPVETGVKMLECAFVQYSRTKP